MPLVVDHVSYLVENKAIIEDVSFVLDGLGLTVLLGPNDAGKSRLLKLCHGLPPLSSGSIRWGNVDPRTARQKQAMVFQRPVLLRRPAAENVDHFLKLRGVPSAERTRVIEESLEWAGLTAVADTPARKLSGGEQQSLTIARARAMNPEVLLLDEPTANLDPAATRRVEDLIRSFAADARKVIMRRIISRRLNASPTRCCPSIEAISSSMQQQRSSYMGHHTRWRCDSLQVS